MAIGKRLRYQVLRRDNYTCRYCGAFAPVAVLVLDHVTPKAHGGQDVMENLVTACEDCNSGKSASLPEFWLAREIKESTAEWKALSGVAPDEDDLAEMEQYQGALRELEVLQTAEVLHWIAASYAAALPYQPTHAEMIICAGYLAERNRLQPSSKG